MSEKTKPKKKEAPKQEERKEQKKDEKKEHIPAEEKKNIEDDFIFGAEEMRDENKDEKKEEVGMEKKDGKKEETQHEPKKRKSEGEETPVPKKPKRNWLEYIPWYYLTPKVLKYCVKFGDPYVPSGKAAMVKIMFDYAKFRDICPECPEIKPRKSKILYSNHPFLKSSFGYSPYINEKGQVSNQLRFEFDEFVLQESRRFNGEFTKEELDTNKKAEELEKKAAELIEKSKLKENADKAKHMEEEAVDCKKKAEALRIEPCGVKGWDYFFSRAVMENYETWSATIKVLTKLVDKDEKGEDGKPRKATHKDVLRKWKSTAREAQKSSFSEYIQFRLLTQQEDPKKGIKEDPYTAFIRVWDMQGKLLTKKLIQKNSTAYDGEDLELIFDKQMYGSGIFCFDHINFTQEAFGLTFTEEDIRIAQKEDIVTDEMNEDPEEEYCPLE